MKIATCQAVVFSLIFLVAQSESSVAYGQIAPAGPSGQDLQRYPLIQPANQVLAGQNNSVGSIEVPATYGNPNSHSTVGQSVVSPPTIQPPQNQPTGLSPSNGYSTVQYGYPPAVAQNTGHQNTGQWTAQYPNQRPVGSYSSPQLPATTNQQVANPYYRAAQNTNLPIPQQRSIYNPRPRSGLNSSSPYGRYPLGNQMPQNQVARRQDLVPPPLAQPMPPGTPAVQAPSPQPMPGPVEEIAPQATPIAGGDYYDYAAYGQSSQGEYDRGFRWGLGLFRNRHCGECGGCEPQGCCRCGWFGSIGTLVMFRDLEDDIVFIQPINDPINNLLVSTDANPASMFGTEVMIGKYFCCCYGVQAVYWGLFDDSSSAEIGTRNSNVVTTNTQTTFSTVNYFDIVTRTNVNTTVNTFFSGTPGFRVSRSNEFHNLELNLLRFSCCEDSCEPCGDGCGGYAGSGYGRGYRRGNGYGAGGYDPCCDPCGSCLGCRPLTFNILAGVRFMQFNENYLFQASADGDFPNNVVADLNYDLDVQNSMVGVQVGGDLECRFCRRWRLVSGTRFGLFGNSIRQTQQIFGPNGFAVSNTGAFTGQPYNIDSCKTDVSLLGQFDIGLNYDIGCRWGVGFGYRVLAINGVALAPTQIPRNFADYQDAAAINSNSGLILHGAFLRAQCNF